MNRKMLITIVAELTRAITGDVSVELQVLPLAGSEQTLVLSTPNGTGRLLGRNGETFRALQRVVSAAAWRTGYSFRLVISDPRKLGGEIATSEQRKDYTLRD